MQQPRTADGRYTFKPGSGDVPEAKLGECDVEAKLDLVRDVLRTSNILNGNDGLKTTEEYHQTRLAYDRACAALGVEDAHQVEVVKACGEVVLQAAEDEAGFDADQLADGHAKLVEQRNQLSDQLREACWSLNDAQEKFLIRRVLDNSDVELPDHSDWSDEFTQAHELACQVRDLSEIINDRTPYLELAEHYKAVLARIRPMGGQHEYHPKASKTAMAAFDEALSCYPSAWIANSNADPNKLLPKIGKSRAHYTHRTTEETKKRVRQLAVTTAEGLKKIGEDPRYELATEEDLAGYFSEDDKDSVREQLMTDTKLAMFDIKLFDPENPAPPRGKGWEIWDHPYRDVSYWRRPQTRMRTTKLEAVSEITTSKAGAGEYATCVHELAHRMEYTARAGIVGLEEGYLDSRTTGEGNIVLHGGRLRRGKLEVARKTDFVDAYMGRIYSEGGAFEIMSCGMEGLFGGSYKGLGGDRDMREFILGVLATR